MLRLAIAVTLCLTTTACVLVGAAPVRAAQLAAIPRAGACHAGSLAAPGDPGYGPYSADYYAPQFSFGYNKPVHLLFAVYTPLNDTAPALASYQVLRSDFSPLKNQPYVVKATGCQQNQTGPNPTTSMFTYSADWMTPSNQGVYYLVPFQTT